MFPPKNNEDIGLLDNMPMPPDDLMAPLGPPPIEIDPDSVAIDGEPPGPGDSFVSQVEFTCNGVGSNGKLQCSIAKVNDKPVGGEEPEAPDAPEDDEFSPATASA